MLLSEVLQSFKLEVFKLHFNKAMVDLFQCWKLSSFKWDIRQSRSLLPMEISVILYLNYIYHLFPQSWKLNFYNYMKSWKHKGNVLKLRLKTAGMAVLKNSRAWESLHSKLEGSLSKFLTLSWELAWKRYFGTLFWEYWTRQSDTQYDNKDLSQMYNFRILSSGGFSKNDSLSNMNINTLLFIEVCGKVRLSAI